MYSTPADYDDVMCLHDEYKFKICFHPLRNPNALNNQLKSLFGNGNAFDHTRYDLCDTNDGHEPIDILTIYQKWNPFDSLSNYCSNTSNEHNKIKTIPLHI